MMARRRRPAVPIRRALAVRLTIAGGTSGEAVDTDGSGWSVDDDLRRLPVQDEYWGFPAYSTTGVIALTDCDEFVMPYTYQSPPNQGTKRSAQCTYARKVP